MAFFQNTVVDKYLNASNKQEIKAAYEKFKAHFHNPQIQQNIRNSKEEQYQEGFLRDLFVNILGYTLNPQNNFNLTTEYKNIKDSKKADGAIVIADKVQAVIELKGTDTTDLGKVEAQAFGYKNNQPDCIYIITSNFEKLRLYIDNAIEHLEFNLFNLTEKQFELLYLCLAYENIQKGTPKKIKDESISQEDAITKKLYKDYSLFKRELYQNLVQLNPEYNELELFKKSQKLLDRFLFLFFAEDRNLLPPNSVRLILNDWRDLQERDVEVPLFERFKKYFGYLNTGFKGKRYDVFAYNGGLFKPDEILDVVKIDDELLFTHTLKLSEYDFASEVDVNILGHIFENSLNELDEIKAQLEGQVIDKSKTKRKKDGVFYTPKYITKYIVENTVGKLCNEKKQELQINEEDYTTDNRIQKKTKQALFDKLKTYREWLLQLTICDPACGSGAFLNQALDFLIAEHRYIDELQAKLFGDSMVLSDVEKSILENNIFGVDLNEESVEIAKLSLWLRTAQPNRTLNNLNNNIQCGNSLIDDPAVAGKKAFNWQQAFPQVFKEKQKKAWHITTATHNSRYSQRMYDNYVKLGEAVWLNEKEEQIVLQTIAEITQKDKLYIPAINICGDHLHLLIVCEEEELTRIVQKIKSMTARACNIAMGKTIPTMTREHAPLSISKDAPLSISEEAPLSEQGYETFDNSITIVTEPAIEYGNSRGTTQAHLWTQKFGKKLITSEEQLYNTIDYIKHNRAKHNLPPLPTKGACSLVDTSACSLIDSIVCSLDHAFRPEYKGGFDVVIGNPPYVLCQPSNTNEITLNFYKSFQVASYKIDLYHLFYEKAIQILKIEGRLGFITPNTFLTNKYIQSLRNFILNNTYIETVVNYNDVVFVDAGVDVATLILRKIKLFNQNIQILNSQNGSLFFHSNKSQFTWNKDSEQVFNLNLENEFIFSNCVEFSEIGNTYFGIQAYDRKSSISDEKLNNTFVAIIDGADIFRYQYSCPTKYFDYKDSNIKSGGDSSIYEKERIVVRQIGQTPIIGYCEKGILTSNTIYNLYITDSNYELKYVFVILNSLFIKKYWLSKYSDNKDLFPKIKGYQLKQLPIPKISLEAQQPFIEKADLMLSLNKDLQEALQKFIRILIRKFPELVSLTREHAPLSGRSELKEYSSPEIKATPLSESENKSLSTKLQNWYSISYKEFIAELSKKKIKLTLSQEAEWEDYFLQEQTKALAIKNQIDSTDKEIDRMVYELYELTEEEIKIVEGI